LPRVGVLVKVGAVEVDQAVRIAREVRRHPVEDHPDAAATSSAEDVPRTLDFLFSRNRLNVAVSRAMCLAYIVASPRLLESRARTIDQMRLINALCRCAEMAGEQVG
jgi:hypothetical protein